MTLSEEVARALGRAPCSAWRLWGVGIGGNEWYKTTPCGHTDCFPPDEPPDYEHNWILTGPLIERFGISLVHNANGGREWEACDNFQDQPDGGHTCGNVAYGSTALVAVCSLVVQIAPRPENPLTLRAPQE